MWIVVHIGLQLVKTVFSILRLLDGCGSLGAREVTVIGINALVFAQNQVYKIGEMIEEYNIW